MRLFRKFGMATLLTGIAMLNSSCDFTGGGGGNDFNASQGVSVNWTGVYKGSLRGGLAVSGTSAGNITRFVLSQAGNSVEVVDDKANKYIGTIGAPGVVANADENGVFPASSLLVQAQITWAGKDEVAQKDIEFVGVLHIVSVTDIQGTTDNSNRTTSDNNMTTTTRDTMLTQGGQQTVLLPGGGSGTEDFSDTAMRNDMSVQTDNRGRTTTSTDTYSVTEANSQFRLEGTWIETGGGVYEVKATSPGGIASIIVGAGAMGGGAGGAPTP